MKMIELKDRVLKIPNCEDCPFKMISCGDWFCCISDEPIDDNVSNETINKYCPLKDFKE